MEEKTFKNLLAVKSRLNSIGYKLSKTTIYDHAKARKIKPRENGFYYIADIEQYAQDYLKKKNEPIKPASEVQQRKNAAETRKLEAQAELAETKVKIISGAYVEKAALERELSYRIMVFKHDLDNFARSEAPKICHLVKGNEAFIPELIEHLDNAFAVFLNRYAEDREFIVPQPDPVIAENLKNEDDDDDDSDADDHNADFLEKTT